MEVSVDHNLGKEKAIRLLDGFIDNLITEYNGDVIDPMYEWVDSVLEWSIKTKERELEYKGTVVASDTDVVVTIDGWLPIGVKMVVRKKVEAALKKALSSPDIPPNPFDVV